MLSIAAPLLRLDPRRKWKLFTDITRTAIDVPDGYKAVEEGHRPYDG